MSRDMVWELLGAEAAERARIAAGLHDGPVQQLVAARLFLESALGPDPGADMAQSSLRALTRATDLLRETMWGLNPSRFGDPDVADEIAAVAARVAPDAVVEVSEPPSGPSDRLVAGVVLTWVADLLAAHPGAAERIEWVDHDGAVAVVVTLAGEVGEGARSTLAARVRAVGGSLTAQERRIALRVGR